LCSREQRVLAAFGRVHLELFVPEELIAAAYDDRPVPIPTASHHPTVARSEHFTEREESTLLWPLRSSATC
jgi:protein-L-isoaspartate O-methyltransferase